MDNRYGKPDSAGIVVEQGKKRSEQRLEKKKFYLFEEEKRTRAVNILICLNMTNIFYICQCFKKRFPDPSGL